MNSKESMKLAVSNIAFGEDQQAALKCVSQSGVEGLVVAPTIIWPSLSEIANLSGQELKDRLGTLKWKAGESATHSNSEYEIFRCHRSERNL